MQRQPVDGGSRCRRRKQTARLPIGRGSDGCVFDSERRLAFSSNGGDGTLTAVKEEGPGQFAVVATIPTQQGARTMCA